VWSPNSSSPALSTYSNIDETYSLSGSGTFNENTLAVDITPSGYAAPVDAPLTTTYSGTALAELDFSTKGLEYLPDGTKIYFYTSTWGATATVSNGSYSVIVPAGTTVNYYVKVNASQNSFSNVVSLHSFLVNGTFFSGTSGSRYLTITVPDTLVTTTISGTAKADLDLSLTGLENLPNGTKITFSTLTWSEAATVTNGNYAINVPIGSNVYYTITSINGQKSATGVTTTRTFQLNNSFFSSSADNFTLNLTAIAIY